MAIKRYAPAVEVIERDESEFVQNPRQLYAGFVGYFNQGPVNTPVLVDNEQSLVATFGKPDNKNYEFWFTASSYLAYSGSLYVVRVKPTGAANATTGFRPLGYEAEAGTVSYDEALFNYDDFSIKDNFDPIHGVFSARETGNRSNSLSVYVCQGKDAWELDLKIKFGGGNPDTYELSSSNTTNSASLLIKATGGSDTDTAVNELEKGHYIETGNTILEVDDITETTIKFKYVSGDSVSIDVAEDEVFEFKRIWKMRNYFSGAPTTSLFAQGLTGSEEVYDEIHVAVVDNSGLFTDVPGTVLERFDGLSVARNAQNNAGESIFWESYINENSNYIYVINSPGGGVGFYVGTYQKTYLAADAGWNFDEVEVNGTTTFKGAEVSLSKLWDNIGNAGSSASFKFTLVDVTDSNRIYTSDENSLVLKNTSNSNTITLKFDDTKENLVLFESDTYSGTSDTLTITITDNRKGIEWNIKRNSIRWGENVTNIANEYDELEYPVYLNFLGGDSGNYVDINRKSDSDIKEELRNGVGTDDSFDVLRNKRELDINLIVSGPLNVNKQATLIDVAEGRYDSVVFLSPARDTGTNDFIIKSENKKLDHILEWKNGTDTKSGLRSSSYTFLDNNWKQVYDRYNSRTRWVPCNGDMAGIVSSLNEPWLSPAGLTNGFIRNALSIAYNPSDAHQDKLYQSSINSIIRKQGQGLVLWGDRTGQEKASAFRSINIRMLFLVVEKALAKYSETLVFELIDEDTMTLARMNINSYLKNVQSRGGIQAFNVILDDSNNTPETIDSQELHVTIRIDATRTINNILLNFVATRSGAAFTVNG